ncbi:MAG: alpha/beta hydrolase [Chloroflexi bacterium]|nr:alpha/beta hydrolase [Chloroflexota bacterium]
MPFVTVQNQRIHYSEHRQDLSGRRLPLVLVHGAGGTLFHWPPGLRRLPDHDVYALDLPGHGRSQGPGRDDVGAYADCVRAWADAVGLARFVLGGHSMGGAIAQMFGLRYPKRLAGLVLVGTGARLRVHPSILQRIQTDKEGVAQQLVEWAHGARASAGQKRQYLQHVLAVDTEVMLGDWQACDRFDVMDQLGQLSVPTLIIAGSQDQMTPVKYARTLAEQIPDADLTVIEGAGHMMMLEQALLVTTAITGFLDRLRR